MQEEINNISTREENEMLWLINGISFDYTFIYDCDFDKFRCTRFNEDGSREEINMNDFVDTLLGRIHPDDFVVYEKAIKAMRDCDAVMEFEVRIKEFSGRRYRWHSVHTALTQKSGRNFYVGSSTLIDSRKKKENELSIQARHDPMTGLLNKSVIRENVVSYLKQNPGKQSAMVIMDIDSFKNYNDCLGHLFGDEIIREVSRRIKREAEKEAFVGRIGGDEFMIFLKDVSDINVIVNFMSRLRDSFKDIQLGQSGNLNVTYSAGVSLYPDMGEHFDELFECADKALYYVKNHGKNSFALYTPDIYDDATMAVTKLSEKDFVRGEDYDKSITHFAFHLLNDASDVKSAINLLLYKMLNKYMLEGIYVTYLQENARKSAFIYECVKDSKNSRINQEVSFSGELFQRTIERFNKNKGALVYDVLKDKTEIPSYYTDDSKDFRSLLQVNMRVLSKEVGIVDFVSRKEKSFWTEERVSEIKTVVNLITVCMYYSQKNSFDDKGSLTDYDSLTGLMNQEAFLKNASRIIATKADKLKLAVVYTDIVNFKYINEVYGFVVGDKILEEMANFILTRIRGVNCCARFHSDNMLFILEMTKDTDEERIKEITSDINMLMSMNLSKKFDIDNILLRTGVYIVEDSTQDAVMAVSNANMARKLAKSQKSGRCVVFDRSMFEMRKKQIGYIQKLDAAIKNEEFAVYFQPKVSSTQNRVVGAEALVRWKQEDGSILYPDEFIPALEKEGSVVKLDFFVYEKTLSYISKRIKDGKKVVPISMNVSRAHLLTTDFVERFKSLIDKYEVPTQFIELELTESIYLDNFEDANEMIERLRLLGIKISMDDFGSGYSSLNALNDLKIDLLKIDRIFMHDHTLKESDKTIIKFIIEMAENLSMKVMCEGVETNDQREFLNSVGCDLHQGFLYSKAVEEGVFSEFLDDEDVLFADVS